MKKKNTIQERIENPSHIQDIELAWDMVHAQKPHIEAAQHAMKHGKFSEVAGALAMAETASDSAAQAVVDAVQTRADNLRAQVGKPEVASSLETKVANTKTALAKRYEAYGVTEADFGLISYEDKETSETINSVIYTGERGIDLGDPTQTRDAKRSYNSIITDNEAHTLAIDGTEHDDRSLNWSMYQVFINTEREAGTNPVPDSQSWSHLPGEKADDVFSRVGVSRDGRPDSAWDGRDGGLRNVLFRPAVVIKD